jgi:hypothetical protein
MPDGSPSSPRAPAQPFGITPKHVTGRALSRWRTVISVVVLAAVMLLAFSGLLGGASSSRIEAQGNGVSGTLEYDPIVRSGNWFETFVTVRAASDVKDLTVAIDHDLWRRMSIDTMVPDAESAEALGGAYAYHFGPVKAGETFRLKLDGQIQPGLWRRQSGSCNVLDVERELMAFPVTLTVLP